ncbi:MAG TPA: hypothetical protein PKA41_06370, partial [Verrucomicrobiota bacterium]|nr:hypothetical protein [Verrucomicrobiota bacterium]
KTFVRCEKRSEAKRRCIRRNEHVSITLYRGERPGGEAEISTTDVRKQARLPLDLPEMAANSLMKSLPQMPKAIEA